MNNGFIFFKQKNLFLIITFFCFSACGQSTLEEKRKETMIETINAIKKNDTLEIFNLVDTTLCFKIQGREGFRRSIRILHKEILINAIRPNNKKFASKSGIANAIDYTIRFDLQNSKSDYVDLIFSFNPTWYKRVSYLEVVFKGSDDSIPLIKAPQ